MVFLWFSYGFPMKTSIFRENDQLNCHGTWTAAPAPFAPRTPKHHRAARASRRPRHPGPVSPGRRLALRSQLQGVLRDFSGIFMVFLWDFYVIFMGFLWDFYGIFMGF